MRYSRNFFVNLSWYFLFLFLSKSWEDHLLHVERVLHVLQANKFFVKREKCQFGQEEVATWVT